MHPQETKNVHSFRILSTNRSTRRGTSLLSSRDAPGLEPFNYPRLTPLPFCLREQGNKRTYNLVASLLLSFLSSQFSLISSSIQVIHLSHLSIPSAQPTLSILPYSIQRLSQDAIYHKNHLLRCRYNSTLCFASSSSPSSRSRRRVLARHLSTNTFE